MQVCQIDNYGIPCWGPSFALRNCLATGTWTNSSQDQQSYLRISQYDVNTGMSLVGISGSPSKFSALDWTDFKDDYGLIAGGMGDGAITLWDVKKILGDGSGGLGPVDAQQPIKMGKGCVSAVNIHSGVAVNTIEFNPHKKNLLASGGAEVLIQDISQNIKSPNVFKPGVPNYHQGSRITAISWNRIVSHILASASENGKIVVWDLKTNKPIFQFTEPTSQISSSSGAGGADEYFDYFDGSGMGDEQHAQKRQQQQQQTVNRETCLVWNPEIPTQFLVANDDDQLPYLNIWDLRNPDYPVATFQDIHYSGIQGVSWSIVDPTMILSSAKDFRTVVTNSKTGEIILEVPASKAYTKMSWSAPLKGKACGMDKDGNASILSYLPEGLYTKPNQQFVVPKHSGQNQQAYAPNWLHPKCGARFGFGNKLITFGQGKTLSLHQSSVSQKLSERIVELDQQLETMDMTQLLDKKIAESHNDIDKLEFTAIKCIHKNKFDDLFKLFGFDKNKVVYEVEKYLGKKLAKPNQQEQQQTAGGAGQGSNQQQQPVVVVKPEFTAMSAESAADFFKQLGQGSEQQNKQQNTESNNQQVSTNEGEAAFKSSKEEQKAETDQKKMQFITESVSKNVNWDEGAEGIIKRNLLVGNLEYAADVALKCGRTTEALLIAEAGGEKLLERIKEEYFMNCKDSYVKLFLRSIVQEEYKEIISNQALQFKNSNWKESLAYLLSYCEGQELKDLLAELGEELLTKKKDINSAIICLIIGKSIEQVFDLWKKRALFLMKKGMDRNEALFLLFEKCILLKTVCNNKTPIVDFDLIVHDMAEFLSNQNLKPLAMKYLDLTNPKQSNVALLRDRVFTSDSSRQLLRVHAKPSFPYQVEKLKVWMSINYQNQKVKQGGQNARQQQNPHIQQNTQQQQQNMNQNQFQNNNQQPLMTQQQQTPIQTNLQRQARPLIGNPSLPQYQSNVTKANFGYGEETVVPLGSGAQGRQNSNVQMEMDQIGQYQNNVRQQAQDFGSGQRIIQPPLPVANRGFNEQIQQDQSRPKIFNPGEVNPPHQDNFAPSPSVGGYNKNQQQSQPKQMIRPPAIQNAIIRQPIIQQQPNPMQMNQPYTQQQPPFDQGRPINTQMQPPMNMNQRMPPPVQQHMHQDQSQSIIGGPGSTPKGNLMAGGGPNAQIKPRPNIPGPQIIRQQPPLQTMNQNPVQTQIKPPMPMQQTVQSGPRPMGMMKTQQAIMTAGSGGSIDTNAQEVLQSLNALFSLYLQAEMNPTTRQQNEGKFQILAQKLQDNQVSPLALGLLKNIVVSVEQGNFAQAQSYQKDLATKGWEEVKTWINVIKALSSFKQKFTGN